MYLQSFLLHDIRVFFCHVYLPSFLLCGVFIPKYMTIFLQMSIYMRTKKAHIYALKTYMCIWGHSRSSYKRHRIIHYTFGNKPTSCTTELESNFSLTPKFARETSQSWWRFLEIAATVSQVLICPVSQREGGKVISCNLLE